jgi:hypothetical protein
MMEAGGFNEVLSVPGMISLDLTMDGFSWGNTTASKMAAKVWFGM